MKTVIIIQARMTSTRLPGKVLKTVMGKPLLEYQIERLKDIQKISSIVIATTINPTDDPLVEFSKSQGLAYFRGSENNVLERYYLAAKENHADAIVRITSDCPLIDPDITSQCIQYFLDNNSTLDYVSNAIERTYPRGLDTEIFSFDALTTAHKNASQQAEKEHVTPYIYRHPEKFRIGSFKSKIDYSQYRWTVDTIEDFNLIENILIKIYASNPRFRMMDVIKLLKKQPKWAAINSHIEQKKAI